MKKLFYLFCFSILFSCSRSGSNADAVNQDNTTAAGLLPTKLTSDGNVTTYKYTGSKITESNSGSFKLTYYYTGDYITKVVSSTGSDEFFYDSNRLTKHILTDIENPQITNTYISEFNWVSNTKILKTETDKFNGNTNASISHYQLDLDNNGNIIKETSLDSNKNYSVIYTYDNKLNQSYYITGYKYLLFALSGGINNILETKKTNISNGITTSDGNIYTYIYNSNNLPTSITEKDTHNSTTIGTHSASIEY